MLKSTLPSLKADNRIKSRLCLRSKGVKGVRSGYAGDLFCHVVRETPVKLTEKQKDLLREFEQLTVEGGPKHNPQSKSWMDKVKKFFE